MNVVRIRSQLQSALTRAEQSDAEFLAPALELIATPPSPIRMQLLVAICSLLLGGLLFASCSHVDIYAVAQGRLQPQGRTKIVQPVESGRVVALHVANGQEVREGDLLVELDPTEAQADSYSVQQQVRALRAELARRTALTQVDGKLAVVPLIAFDADIPTHVRQREQRVFATELAELYAQLASVAAQIDEGLARQRTSEATIIAQRQLLQTMEEQVQMRRTLLQERLESKLSLTETVLRQQKEATNLASQEGELVRTRAGIVTLEAQRRNLLATFLAKNAAAAGVAEARLDELQQVAIKAGVRHERTQLRASTAGTVQDVAITTVGQVVSGGQQLMSVVPIKAPLEFEVLVLNRDIGFVEVGQECIIKLDAFPFTRYGTLTGTVNRVSHDSVTQDDARMQLAAEAPLRPYAVPTAPAIAGLVFPITVSIREPWIVIDGKRVAFTSGMTGTAEIKTGRHRLLEYITSPIEALYSSSGHER